jgi:hypothetical protein
MQEIHFETKEDEFMFSTIISLGHQQLPSSKSLHIDRDFHLPIWCELQISKNVEKPLNDSADLNRLSLGELLDRCENRSTYGLDRLDEISAITRCIPMLSSDGLFSQSP